MTDAVLEEGSDRIIIRLCPRGPVDLEDLTQSFAALARMYERHHRPPGAKEPAPKLFITKLESGSVIAEIVPYAVLLGTLITTMDSGLIVSEFTRRLCIGIKAFSDPTGVRGHPATPMVSRDDAEDLRAFMQPLAGKKRAELGIRHARFERTDGEARTVAEYSFDEAEINRATINLEHALERGSFVLGDDLIQAKLESPILKEVMLFFEQASRKPGKEKGRTGDRGIIPDVSQKSLPVYFRKSFQSLKDQMVRGDINPLTNSAFVVDVHVQKIDDEPQAYIVTNVHLVVPLGGAEHLLDRVEDTKRLPAPKKRKRKKKAKK